MGRRVGRFTAIGMGSVIQRITDWKGSRDDLDRMVKINISAGGNGTSVI
jgi:hypothetical protein